MTYATLMVHAELGRSNTGLARIAGDLTALFDAGAIGIAACQPMRIIYSEGYIPGDLIARDRDERVKEIATAEAEFRDRLQPRVRHFEWRSTITDEPLSAYMSREGRGADLVMTMMDRNASFFDNTRHLDVGDFVMHVGRPVLIVPSALEQPKFDRVLVGWKDSRETRRAIADALPFLRRAAHVAVAEIADEASLAAARARLDDVCRWLARHGVVAEAIAAPSDGDDARQLRAITSDQAADLIVAGAYGHSRVREWVLGGVTRDLLLGAEICSLVSH